jgi:hypothetical protein
MAKTRCITVKAQNVRNGDFIMPTYFNGYSPDGFVVTSTSRLNEGNYGEYWDIIGDNKGEVRSLTMMRDDLVKVERDYPNHVDTI